MSAQAPAVLLDAATPVWRLTLNRPAQGNACSPALVAAVSEALARAEAAGAQALVLQGEGRHFCTGFDLSGLESETDDTLLARFVRIELLLQQLARAPFLTVALAHGRTVGAGADLFAACELRLARPGTSFSFPGARGFGLVLGTRRLATRVGAAVALDWVESARTIDAAEAARAGLVAEVLAEDVDPGELIAARMHDDGSLRAALRHAVAPCARAEDAEDFAQLVRSAARPGLRQRIAAYVERAAATRLQASSRRTA